MTRNIDTNTRFFINGTEDNSLAMVLRGDFIRLQTTLTSFACPGQKVKPEKSPLSIFVLEVC